MINFINEFSNKFIEETRNKKIQIISHFDTDGITSASIITKTLERLENHFSTKIIKSLSTEEINNLPKDKIIIMLDIGSGNIEQLALSNKKIFIIDHHEISINKIPENISILNPHLINEENLCTAELSYLFSKSISQNNKDLAYLAVLGMVGDVMEKNLNLIKNQIIKDSNIIIKKGLLIYPSTRPLDRALEFSSKPFIPGITGNLSGTYKLLNDINIKKIGKKYKALIDLNEEEMKDLTTTVALKLAPNEITNYIGNLYLIKLFNKIEDAREISAMINACSRMGESQTALLFCLGNSKARKKAEKIYMKYKQLIISGLKYIEKNKNIIGNDYIIINARDNIKDTIIGTLASILSFSSSYKQGTVIIAMAYNKDKIKVSARIVDFNNDSTRNLKKLMDSITKNLGQGNSGGHKKAAGCIINIEKENEFIELIKKEFEYELIKI
ncbi:MAG: DHH family phosphoesterase [Nanoarchaeota archaeon]